MTVIEYLSITCSHCAAFERDTWPEIERVFVRSGQVRYIIREMPTAPVALSAAGFLLARCTGRDSYWDVVQALLRHQGEVFSAPTLAKAVEEEAQIAHLSPDAAEACLTDPASIDSINSRRQAGLSEGVDSTPYFIINSHPLRPGVRLAGETYQGGELNFRQFADAIARFSRGSERVSVRRSQ